MRFREMKTEDSAAALSLTASTGVFTDAELECLKEEMGAYFDGEFGDDLMFVCEDQELLGFAHFGRAPITDETWYLYWIAVSRPYANQGIGRRFLAEIETYLRSRQARLLLIETSSQGQFAPTRSFYERNEYKLVGVLPDYYRDGDDRCTYAKKL